MKRWEGVAGEEGGERIEAEIRMSSVCKGHVPAFCGSLYQQRICQSTDKSLFTPILVVFRSFVLQINYGA